MATYAALVSLTNLIDQIHLYHDRRPTFTDEQLLHILYLQEKAYFLQDFLENYNLREGVLTKLEQARLERQITNEAYRAEDIIESKIVDDIIESQIVDDIDARLGQKQSYDDHLSHLPGVISFMDSITKRVTMIKENNRPLIDHQRRDLVPLGPAKSTTMEKDTTLLFDGELEKIMTKLIGHGSCLQILPITGMGGIGKTTLAKHAYDNAYVVEYFDIRGWITLSQAYDTREILLGFAPEIGVHMDEDEKKNIECHQLVVKLHKHLSGRRYLIIIDDIWDTDAWDKLKASFPENKNESRIVVTSRLSNVANYVASSDIYQMNLLDDDKSWRLLCRKVFVGECCPLELEEIGKKIAKSCKGLPLSIAVIGGLLAKSKMTQEYWEYVANNISTTINFEDDKRCLKILSLSYEHLPIHLKPCFLYMGVFPEDHEIRVQELIKLWVAEGFLKPNKEKTMEEVAEDYLKDLIGRNLIFVKLGFTSNLKICKIHDLLRGLCLEEAQRERFFFVSSVHNQDSKRLARRLAIHHNATQEEHCVGDSYALQSTSLARTVLSFTSKILPSIDSKLLRICSVDNFSRNKVTCSMNSRYLSFRNLGIPDQIDCFWNLQTLVMRDFKLGRVAPSEIWEMPQLRHIMVHNISLPDPPSGRAKGHGDFVLRNLQTLSRILNFRCTEEVPRRIPNIKKLKVEYSENDKGLSHYCSKNLEHLHKLQSLHCSFSYGNWVTRSDLLHNLEFSTSLKKLTLQHCNLGWEDIATKIGPLPNLEKLKLWRCFNGEEWSPVEGQFLRLKFLGLRTCRLVRWTAEGTHFPCLERLVLEYMGFLEEIPLGFADIATLQSIVGKWSNKSVVASAKEIREEQQNLGNEDFRLTLVGEDGSSDEEKERGEEENGIEAEEVDDNEAGEDDEVDDHKEAGREENKSRGFSACLGFIRKCIR